MRRCVVGRAWGPNVVLGPVCRKRIEILVAVIRGAVALAHPGNSVCDRGLLTAKLGLQDEIVVLPERLGGVNVGIGSDVLAIIGACDSRGGSDKCQSAQRGKETGAWGSHSWEGLSTVLTSSPETIENESHNLLAVMETDFTDQWLCSETRFQLPQFACRNRLQAAARRAGFRGAWAGADWNRRLHYDGGHD